MGESALTFTLIISRPFLATPNILPSHYFCTLPGSEDTETRICDTPEPTSAPPFAAVQSYGRAKGPSQAYHNTINRSCMWYWAVNRQDEEKEAAKKLPIYIFSH